MTQTANKTELANKVIRKIMACLTQDWLAKEVNRYLGDLSLNFYLLSLESRTQTSPAPSEFAPIEHAPLLSFAKYLAKIDGGQIFPTLSIQLSDGAIIYTDKILEELVGADEDVRKKMKEGSNFITWLQQHFPSEYQLQFDLAESVAESGRVEARIQAAYAEAIETATTDSEGLSKASKQLGDFMKNFPQETSRTYFKDAIRNELTEEQVRELVRANEIRRSILYTQQTHL